MEGFGQSETTLVIGNLVGTPHKLGSMGKPTPLYDVRLLDPDGNEVPTGEIGEIAIRTADGAPCGLLPNTTLNPIRPPRYGTTGIIAAATLRGRMRTASSGMSAAPTSVIKSSGYRIGPFEIESVIMELPYVLECGVSAAPDDVRGQVVKASIVLTKGTEATEELKKEIQLYVKEHTAPYKYPRIVEFKKELPKTTSGKIQRNKL